MRVKEKKSLLCAEWAKCRGWLSSKDWSLFTCQLSGFFCTIGAGIARPSRQGRVAAASGSLPSYRISLAGIFSAPGRCWKSCLCGLWVRRLDWLGGCSLVDHGGWLHRPAPQTTTWPKQSMVIMSLYMLHHIYTHSVKGCTLTYLR